MHRDLTKGGYTRAARIESRQTLDNECIKGEDKMDKQTWKLMEARQRQANREYGIKMDR